MFKFKKVSDPFNDPMKKDLISWKSIELLKKYMNRFGNIKPRKYTWLSVSHQKMMRNAIIRSRELWLLVYIK